MSDKICFNKTLTYLVLLVAAVVGAFYVMNYANSQKLGGTPKAGAQTCKGKGGSQWYRDTTTTALDKRLTTSTNDVTVTEIAGPYDDSYYADQGLHCYKVVYASKAPSGPTCKGKGGSEWFRDATADVLKKRLETPYTIVTVKEVTGASDALYYPGKKCYTVSYKYKTETGSTCKELKGAWYRDSSETALETRLSTPDLWKADATLISSASDASYYPGRTCYKVNYIYEGQ